jgi:hypothetical protein
VFSGFILGCTGIIQIFLASNIGIIASAPDSQSGIVGAVFNAALQLGTAVGSAAITSIQQNIDGRQPDPEGTFKGRRAGFWFLVAVIVVEMIGFVIFYRTSSSTSPSEMVKEEEIRPERKVDNRNSDFDDIESRTERLSEVSSRKYDETSIRTTTGNGDDFRRRMLLPMMFSVYC